jgi:hypothetical protein
MESNIVQLRKKGGIENIVKDKNGGKLRPMLYNTGTKDITVDGNLEGDYRGKTILDTRHFLSPMWNDMKKQWSFSGNEQDLVRLIDKMKLRYPKNHPDEGKIITATVDVHDRLTNRMDDVFNHPAFYGKYFMENGRIALDLGDPKQEFMYLCYKGDSSVQDLSSDKVVSKYFSAGSKYELISPKKENQRARKHADREVLAITLLGAMGSNEEKMRSIALIMGLPQYSSATDSAGLFILLKDRAVQNTSISAKYGKSYQERFIELSEMSDEDLNVNGQVMHAKKKGIIRKRKDHYLFNGDRIDGVVSDIQLTQYFKDPKRQEEYIKLLDLLDDGN